MQEEERGLFKFYCLLENGKTKVFSFNVESRCEAWELFAKEMAKKGHSVMQALCQKI